MVVAPYSSLLPASRHHLMALETETARHIHSAWQQTTVRLSAHVQTFTDAYAAALHATRTEAEAHEESVRQARVPLIWLTQTGRTGGGNLAALKTLVRLEVAAFAAHAHRQTVAAQRAAVEQATQSMRDFTTPSDALLYARVDHQRDGVPLSRLYDLMGDTASAAMVGAIFAALSVGREAALLARDIWRMLDRSMAAALTILRTELMGAFRDALTVIFGHNPDAITGWIWRATGPNPCPFCLSMDGTKHAPGDTLDSHPNCYCQQEPIIESE